MADQHADTRELPECPVCGEVLNEDYVTMHLLYWHDGDDRG